MKLRILDFDIENRPLAYLGADFTTAEVTAIAAGFIGEKKIWCWLLGRDSYKSMLGGFRELYEAADMVTGHYIRKHDLPVLNGAMIEAGLGSLGPKLASDTKLDFVVSYYLSESQENLAQMLGIEAQKTHMSNASWREANRLTRRGIELTRARAIGDVQQHMALRAALVERDLLQPPKVWRPSRSRFE